MDDVKLRRRVVPETSLSLPPRRCVSGKERHNAGAGQW